MNAFLVFAANHLAVVLIGEFDPVVAKAFVADVGIPLPFRTLQLLLGVEVVACIAGVFALLHNTKLLLVGLRTGHIGLLLFVGASGLKGIDAALCSDFVLDVAFERVVAVQALVIVKDFPALDRAFRRANTRVLPQILVGWFFGLWMLIGHRISLSRWWNALQLRVGKHRRRSCCCISVGRTNSQSGRRFRTDIRRAGSVKVSKKRVANISTAVFPGVLSGMVETARGS